MRVNRLQATFCPRAGKMRLKRSVRHNMKHYHIALLILLAPVVAGAEALPLPIIPGTTNRLDHSTWIYVHRVESTNMYDVMLYQRQFDGGLRIADARHAHADVDNGKRLTIHFRDVKIVTEQNGELREIQARHYPVSFDIDAIRAIQRDYGATSGSPKDDINAEHSRDGIPYPVQAGDTLTSISEIFGVSIPDILKWNPKLERHEGLRTGRMIWIPPLESKDVEPANSAYP